MKRNGLIRSIIIAVVALFALKAQAAQVTILTGFPKEVTDLYKTAFETRYPDMKVEIINKSTTASVAYLRATPAGQRPDIFWASAPDAFSLLAKEQLLEKLQIAWDPGVPEKVGGYPINDPDGFYRGQALAGYGIMWNTPYLKAKKLTPPKEWIDLTKSGYFGHVVMSSPSKSGTTHLTVETILQGEGWDVGWKQLLMIAGNCAAITERSTDVPDGVNSGKYGAGLVIDFFGHSGKYTGSPVEFAYPSVTAIVPASIAVIAGAKNAEAGKKFMAFSLSSEGQILLLDPKISRLPILPGVYTTSNIPRDFPNVYQVARKAKVKFDTNLSQSRYGVIGGMFDQVITSQIKDLQGVTKAIQDAERKAAKRKNKAALAMLVEARKIVYAPVVNSETSVAAETQELYKKQKDPEVAKKIALLEEKWRNQAKENYAKGLSLAQTAANMK